MKTFEHPCCESFLSICKYLQKQIVVLLVFGGWDLSHDPTKCIPSIHRTDNQMELNNRFRTHSKIHNPKSTYLFLYLFTNKILFKKKLLILLFYYIIFRICKLFSVIYFLYTYICGPYICNLNMKSIHPKCFQL